MHLKLYLWKDIATTREILNVKSTWSVPNFQNTFWIWRNQGITPIVKWRIAKKDNSKISPNYFKLCLTENAFIIKSLDDCNLINKRSELFSKCRQQNKLLLCNVKRNDSIDWCLELYFVFIFNIFFLFIFRQNSENMNYPWRMLQLWVAYSEWHISFLV